MLIEMQTLSLKIGAGGAVSEILARHLPGRVALSPLAGCFETEIGTLNQIVLVWPYDDFAHRAAVARAVDESRTWPPDIRAFLIEEELDFLEPLSFSSPLVPGRHGDVYEFRTYTYGPGFMPEVEARWAEKIVVRRTLSPFIGAWRSISGRLDQLVHVWAYDDAAQRQRIRAEAIASGAWPPNTHAEGMLLKQQSVLTVPAAFSPLR